MMQSISTLQSSILYLRISDKTRHIRLCRPWRWQNNKVMHKINPKKWKRRISMVSFSRIIRAGWMIQRATKMQPGHNWKIPSITSAWGMKSLCLDMGKLIVTLS